MNETLTEQIRQQLITIGVDETTITDDVINAWTKQAEMLAGVSLEPKTSEEYTANFRGKVYLTDFYPLLSVENLELWIDGELVTPKHVQASTGIIYLEKEYKGILECNYTYGFDETSISQLFIPLVLALMKDADGGNLASISEGDVSISYDRNGNTSTTIDSLILNIQSKFGVRARFL